MNRDLKSNVDAAVSLLPAARVNGTGTGTTIDTLGYDSAMLVVNFGAWTDGTHTPALQHSADGTTFTDAGTDGVLQGTFTAVSGTAGASQTYRVGYAGMNRYVRAIMVTTGATTGALSDATVVRGHPARAPLP